FQRRWRQPMDAGPGGMDSVADGDRQSGRQSMIFDHVGVTTTDLPAGRALLEGSIGVRAWTAEFRDEINEVWVQFGRCDAGMCYELVAPLSPRSPVANVLSRKINVLNHLAYLVDDLP